MARPSYFPFSLPVCCLVVFGPLLLAGCREEPLVVVQKVAKLEKPAGRDRMLAAVVPVGETGWFFKLAGNGDRVQAEEAKFRKMLETLTIADGKPVWKCPEDWQELPGQGMRAATFEIGSGEEKLECTVIALPAEDPKSDDYLLSNVNRWRDQLGIPKLSLDELKASLTKSEELGQINLADQTTVTWVNLAGSLKPSSSMAPFAGGGAPFAGGGGPREVPRAAGPMGPAGPPGPASATASDAGNSPASIPELTFEVPQGWAPGRVNAFRKVAWTVRDGDKAIEIYISTSGGDLEGNVNRWRTQVGLEPLEGAALAETMQKIEVGGRPGHYVELKGPEQATLGAIVLAETGWFFKLNGDAQVAEREKENFRRFLASVKFTGKP